MAMQAQKLFHGPPRRRRRGGLAGQAYFTDALQILKVTVKATGDGAEALSRWEAEVQPARRRAAEEIEPSLLAEAGADATSGAPGAPGRTSAAPAGPDDEGEEARRRRRGGRRRRRRGSGRWRSAAGRTTSHIGGPVAGRPIRVQCASPSDPP